MIDFIHALTIIVAIVGFFGIVYVLGQSI